MTTYLKTLADFTEKLHKRHKNFTKHYNKEILKTFKTSQKTQHFVKKQQHFTKQ